MIKIDFITETYQLIEGEGYCIDIVKNGDVHYIYMYHIDCDIKMYLYTARRCRDTIPEELIETACAEAIHQIPNYKNTFRNYFTN